MVVKRGGGGESLASDRFIPFLRHSLRICCISVAQAGVMLARFLILGREGMSKHSPRCFNPAA